MNKNRIFPLLLTLSLVLSFFAGANQLPASAQPQAAGPLIPLLLGQAGGASVALTYEVYSEGYGYLYVGVGPRLYIYWVDQVTVLGTPTLTLRGVSEPLPGVIQGVAMYGNLAYVTLGENGIAIIDMGVDKKYPVILNSYDTPGFARGLWITSTKIAYIADGENGILVLDVLDPHDIKQVGSYNTDGNARSVIRVGDDIFGDLLYVADGEKGLLVLEVEYPNILVKLSAYDTTNAEDVFFSDKQPNYLYLADGNAGIKVFFIKDPDQLSIYKSKGPLEYAQSIMFYGGEIYVADGLGGLYVISCSDTGCLEIGYFDTPGLASELAWAEKIVFIADTSALRAINASTPSAPFEVTTASRESPAVPGKLVASGSTVYIADPWQGLRILDAANPAAPALIRSYDTPGTAKDVALSGNIACIADGPEGLLLLDTSSPITQTLTTTIPIVGEALAVTTQDEVIYVAAGSGGLVGLTVTQTFTNTLVVTGAVATPGIATDVAVSGNYAYVAAGASGLAIINRLPLDNMTLVQVIDTPGTASAVAVQGSYAYVADGASGLQIFNIADPTTPVLAGSIDTPGSAVDVAIMGFLAYIADSTSGLHVINIANPTAPSLLFSYDTIGSTTGVALSDGGIFAADAQGGLLVFTPPPDSHSIMLPLVVR